MGSTNKAIGEILAHAVKTFLSDRKKDTRASTQCPHCGQYTPLVYTQEPWTVEHDVTGVQVAIPVYVIRCKHCDKRHMTPKMMRALVQRFGPRKIAEWLKQKQKGNFHK